MTKVNLYNIKGVKKDSITLPKTIDEAVSPSLIAQSVRVYEDRTHLGTSYAKTRAEINATGKKVWKQKGTGNARHGSRRAPIFVGGGKAHGPKGIKRILTLPTKMRQLALRGSFNLKAKVGGIAFVDGLSGLSKTKDASMMVKKVLQAELSGRKLQKVLVVLNNTNSSLVKFFRNIKDLKITFYKNLNAHVLLTGGLTLIDNSIFEVSKPKVSQKKAKVVSKKSK